MNTETNRGRQKHILVILSIVAALIVLLVAIFLVTINNATLTVTLNGDQKIAMEYGDSWEDPGATYFYEVPYLDFLNRRGDAAPVNKIDSLSVGEQPITYAVDFKNLHSEALRVVSVEDTTGPVITLVSDADYYTSPNAQYEEEGFIAFDLHDGDLTEKVKRTETKEKVTYTVSDSFGNTTSVEREIVYDDRTPPEIILEGDTEANWLQGVVFEDKFSATDDVDGDITSRVEVAGGLDVNVPGDYRVTYTVEDSYKNKATAERFVRIVPKGENNGHYVYLTFDDGPGQYTERLLNLLDKYNVKATFFITGFFDYPELITEEARRGHSVGVHTYTHKYEDIYSSEEAFWEDFERVQDLIEKQTGSRTKLMRFAGGSSNDISALYSKGIMTRLTAEAEARGYTYFDWNVSSGDAGITEDPKVILERIKEGIETFENAIVLCHDIKEYTVDAMEDVLIYGLENGYTFLPLTENSPTAHHELQN